MIARRETLAIWLNEIVWAVGDHFPNPTRPDLANHLNYCAKVNKANQIRLSSALGHLLRSQPNLNSQHKNPSFQNCFPTAMISPTQHPKSPSDHCLGCA